MLPELCIGVCFPDALVCIFKTKPARKQFCKRFPPGRPQISAPHPRILACVWPRLAAAARFQSSRPWSRSELECSARKGAPWRPPERPRLRVVRGGGWGVSRPNDENSKCSPAWAANRFQIGRVRARAAAAWLHKQPVAPDGGWLQPGEQVHGGLGGVAAGGGPPPRLAGAGRPLLPLIHAALSQEHGASGAAEVEPIAWRRKTEAQKGPGIVQG